MPKKTGGTTKGWPPERRQAQADRIRQTKPWTKSTGPKSTEGKARSARNGTTHGLHTPEGQHLRKALRRQCREITLLAVLWNNLSPDTLD